MLVHDIDCHSAVSSGRPGFTAIAITSLALGSRPRRPFLRAPVSCRRPTATGESSAPLVLPFGLAVTKPATLQVDEGATMPLSIRTCLPIGGVVSLTFEAAAVKALKSGTVLNVKTTADNAQESAFRISLKGFASALDRTAALSK
jgi:invasion protein IalB